MYIYMYTCVCVCRVNPFLIICQASSHAERWRGAEAREAELLEANGQLTTALAQATRSLEENRRAATTPRIEKVCTIMCTTVHL